MTGLFYRLAKSPAAVLAIAGLITAALLLLAPAAQPSDIFLILSMVAFARAIQLAAGRRR